MRVLCHAPYLSGVGHYVRMRALAHGLSAAHEVHFVEGGPPVPGLSPIPGVDVIRLPPIARERGRIVAHGGGDTAAVLAARSALLANAVARLRPDVVLIDHYPFSKWELEPEMTAVIDGARAAKAASRIVCSLRDVAPQTRHEPVEPQDYEARVLAILRARFDALLVHVDPRFTRLEEHFARTADIPVAVHHTGFVAEPAPAAAAGEAEPRAVLSCGGGGWNLPFLCEAVKAYRRAYEEGAVGTTPLLVFLGAFAATGDRAALETAAGDVPIEIREFAADFEAHLRASPLSLSRAGYNTCTALLRSRVRSVLVPDPSMSDQAFRARRMQALGLAVAVEGEATAAEVAAAIRRAVAAPPPVHALDLDGAGRTCAILEAMAPG